MFPAILEHMNRGTTNKWSAASTEQTRGISASGMSGEMSSALGAGWVCRDSGAMCIEVSEYTERLQDGQKVEEKQ
jgi:hypothetical protein